MKVNCKELGDRLSLECSKSSITFKGSLIEYIRFIGMKIDNIAKQIIQRQNLRDVDSQLRVKAICSIYKFKCAQEFKDNQTQ